MSEAATSATRLHKLRHTPLRDLVRLRLTGRLDLRRHVRIAGLPQQAEALILRVVRRTRLWRSEQIDVADELIAHFGDGLAAGADVDGLLRAFGDERAAARLIRRAKRRSRRLSWHLSRWAMRAALLLIALYIVVLARFLWSRPTVSVDYLVQLNAPIARVPEADRARPLYAQAMITLGVAKGRQDNTLSRVITAPEEPLRELIDATPADAAWPELTAWLDAHAEGFTLLHAAAAKPAMGLLLSRRDALDDEGGPVVRNDQETLVNQSLVRVLLPELNHFRRLAEMLSADARYALQRGDAQRVAADLEAMLGLARHQSSPILITRLVGLGIYQRAFDEIETTLRAAPELLSDAQLVRLAHQVARVGGDTASSLIDLSAEKLLLRDMVQRMYTDDGNGDGRLAAEGTRAYMQLIYGKPTNPGFIAAAGAMSAISSRREAVAEHERLIEIRERQMSRPMRETAGDADVVERRLTEIMVSPLMMARYFPVSQITPSLSQVGWTAERCIGRREGVCIGIALELYRRRNDGRYPATLDELVPALLPSVPVDRITGDPLNYRLIDGRPVVYSVGVDRDDDGGTPPLGKDGKPDPRLAAQWQVARDQRPVEGDWILFDARPQPTSR